jgi:hypothetical protein
MSSPSNATDRKLPECTNKKTAELGGRTYQYDCSRCEACLESIRVIKGQLAPVVKTLVVALAFVGLSLTNIACATIMHGTTQKVPVTSTLSGSKVYVDGKEAGVTPVFLELERGTEHVVTIEAAPGQRQDVALRTEVSGWVWGNIVLGGLIGLGIDYAAGGLYNLEPAAVSQEARPSLPVADIRSP